MRLFFAFVFLLLSFACAPLACGPDREDPAFGYVAADAAVDAHVALRADDVPLAPGVDDGDRDPSVVYVDGAGRSCNAVLIAGDAVLTSSVCVGADASALEIRETADGPPTARGARVIESSVIPTVGAAFAVVLLDRPVVASLPTWVRSSPAIAGAHLRTAGFEDAGNSARKTLRDHLVVFSARLDDFEVSENPCSKEEGAPAFDEDTEELVGMVLMTAPCSDPYVGTTYTRVLPLRDFLESALDASANPDGGPTDAGKRQHGSKGKAVTDLRGVCEAGVDCAAGVCIDQKGASTCSRECGSGDRCPATFHCQRAVTEDDGGVMVCADP
ncbi:MAG: hypothetical protein ACRELY_04755 [Polyangiaceae bacterium]